MAKGTCPQSKSKNPILKLCFSMVAVLLCMSLPPRYQTTGGNGWSNMACGLRSSHCPVSQATKRRSRECKRGKTQRNEMHEQCAGPDRLGVGGCLPSGRTGSRIWSSKTLQYSSKDCFSCWRCSSNGCRAGNYREHRHGLRLQKIDQ